MGDEIDRLWANVTGCWTDRLTIRLGGEQLRVGGRRLDVEHTPGARARSCQLFLRRVRHRVPSVRMRRSAGIRGYAAADPTRHRYQLARRPESRRGGPTHLFLTQFVVGVTDHATWPTPRQSRTGRRRWPGTRWLGRTDEEREGLVVEEFVRQMWSEGWIEPETDADETANRLDLDWRGLARYRASAAPSVLRQQTAEGFLRVQRLQKRATPVANRPRAARCSRSRRTTTAVDGDVATAAARVRVLDFST